jgi:hypothetical protein
MFAYTVVLKYSIKRLYVLGRPGNVQILLVQLENCLFQYDKKIFRDVSLRVQDFKCCKPQVFSHLLVPHPRVEYRCCTIAAMLMMLLE